MTLQEALTALASARLAEHRAADALTAARAQMWTTPEGLWASQSSQSPDSATANRQGYEQIVRDLAVTGYQATGNKKPMAGITIKLFRRVEYNVFAAIEWCKLHAPTLLIMNLDAKTFDKIAENYIDSGAPAAITFEPHPQIATDLSEYLPKEPLDGNE